MDKPETVESLRERESELRKERLRLEALRDNAGLLPECERCGVEFVGRSDARFCSTRCRVAAHRAQKKTEGQMTEAEKKAKADEAHKAELLEMLERYREDTKAIALGAKLGEWGPVTNEKILYWLRCAIEDIEALE